MKIFPSRTELCLVPLRDMVIFPNMVVPFFVGRKKSIRAVQEAMGKGKVLFVSGEAGIGKSRIVLEFKETLAGEDLQLFEWHCRAFGRSIPFHPLSEILGQHCSVIPGGSWIELGPLLACDPIIPDFAQMRNLPRVERGDDFLTDRGPGLSRLLTFPGAHSIIS